MKILVLSLSLLLASTYLLGQRRSKVDPKDVQIDSLKQTTSILTLQLDSVSKELVKYVGVYDAIKEKVLLYNFDPTRSAYLIDSLKASRDSTLALLNVPKSTTTADSLYLVLRESTMLKARIDSILVAWGKEKSALTAEEIDKAKAVSNLKQLKELLDAKIISEAEYVALKKKYLEQL